tara:strand:+ start:31 stop:1104 length:1074 start_codon:yes stop_codon:yes gene_type:complete
MGNPVLMQQAGMLDPMNYGSSFDPQQQQFGKDQNLKEDNFNPPQNPMAVNSQPMLNPNNAAWGAALQNIGNIYMGQAPQQNIGGAYMAAKQSNDKVRMNKTAMARQEQQDALNTRYRESQITENLNGPTSEKGGAIGSPVKLDNGNIGVTKYNPESGTYEVVDTGSAFRGNPDLGEKLQYETDLYELKEKSKYQDILGESEASWVSAESTLTGLRRAEQLLMQGVETGTYKSAFAPEMWKSDEAQEMTALINGAVLDASQLMSGVLSETDMKFLKGETISQDKSPAANMRVLKRKMSIIESAQSESKRKFQHFQNGGNYFDWKPAWAAMDDPANPTATSGGGSADRLAELRAKNGIK